MNIGIYQQRAATGHSGGTESSIRQLVSEIPDEYDVTIFCETGDTIDIDTKIVQIPCLSKDHELTSLLSKTYLKSAEIGSLSMRASQLLQPYIEDVDILTTHYYLDPVLLRHLDIPIVFKCEGIKSDSIRWQILRRFGQYDAVIANSSSTRQRLEDIGFDVGYTLYPSVRDMSFEYSRSDNFTWLYVGRLDEGKGLHDMLSVTDDLDCETVVVGDGHLRDELERKHDANFVGHQENVEQFYHSADGFCLPSYHESFGIVNIEAMACGTPVVTTDIDAITEYAVDEVNSLLFTPGDRNQLHSKMEMLMEDDDFHRSLAHSGRETSEEYMTSQGVQFVRICEDIL